MIEYGSMRGLQRKVFDDLLPMALGQPSGSQVVLVVSRRKSESCPRNSQGRVQSKTERPHFCYIFENGFLSKMSDPDRTRTSPAASFCDKVKLFHYVQRRGH